MWSFENGGREETDNHKPRNTWGHEKLEEAGKDLPLGNSEGGLIV